MEKCYFAPEVDIAFRDFSQEKSFKDAKKLLSLLWNQELLIHKKRRWLMGPISTFEGNQKRSKKPKFLTNTTNKLLLESDVRSDEVSFEKLRNNVEKSFGSYTPGEHHVVQDYLELFSKHKMEICAVNPLHLLQKFYAIMDDLNNTGLLLVANIVTSNKASFEKTRPSLQKVITEYLPKALVESDPKERMALLTQLSYIFRNPNNFRKKQLTLLTPVCAPLLTSMHRLLERLDEMPIQTLIAINRKIRGVNVAPQFPPVLSACRRDIFIKRIRDRFDKKMLTLREGSELPKPLAKAFSVMLLSLKKETKFVDIEISEIFPFPPEVRDLQNDILRALWSLPKVKYNELKDLQSLVDPQATISWKSFRKIVRKYLIEYLFGCDEVDLSEEVLRILSFINRRSRRQPCMLSKEMKEDEVESVLNVSSQLKNMFSDLLAELDVDKESATNTSDELESNGGSEANDFILTENNYGSNPDDDMGTTGDSMPSDSSLNIANSGILFPDTNTLRAFSESELFPQNTLHGIQDLCDETSLLGHKIIGHFLDRVMQLEGRDTDVITRSYLRGGTLPPLSCQDSDALSGNYTRDMGPMMLLQIAEELLPNLPKSSIESVWKI